MQVSSPSSVLSPQGGATAPGPGWARPLGWFGLVPFWGLALAAWFGPAALQGFALTALLAYGATILSFLGGLSWGFALADLQKRPPNARHAWLFGLGVLPQLLGWGALLLGGPWAFVAVAGGLLALLLIDRHLVRAGDAPAWFGQLRWQLSSLASLAMLAGALR